MSSGLSRGTCTIVVGSGALKDLIEFEGGVELPDGAEVCYGDFKVNSDGELEFEIAWDSTDNHPASWAKGPDWLMGIPGVGADLSKLSVRSNKDAGHFTPEDEHGTFVLSTKDGI
jgi:hypothetical protein